MITYTAKEVRLDPETGIVPAFDRNIKAAEVAVPLTEKKICTTTEEILQSSSFKIVVTRFFQKQNRESEVADFISFAQSRATSSAAQKNQPSPYFKDAQDLLNFWRNSKFRFHITHAKSTTAVQDQDTFEKIFRDLLAKYNAGLSADNQLNEDHHSYSASAGLAQGNTKRDEPHVFSTSSFAYPVGINMETARSRREAGAPIPIQHGHPLRKEILGDPEERSWISHRINIGGMPVEVCLNDAYGADLLLGLQSLMGGEAIESLPVKAPPVLKLYFGVSDDIMRGDERRIFAHPQKRFLGIMVADIRGYNPRTGEAIGSGEPNELFNHYFGYLKKSLLSLQNMWVLMVSATTQKKYYLNHIADEPDSAERQRRRVQINEIKKGMPDQLQPLYTKLSILMDNDPDVFEARLPRVTIPEIEYDTDSPNFDATRYSFLPVHGAFYTVEYTNVSGEKKSKNLMFPGDSGVGKSEVMRALIEQGIAVTDILADDMLYLIADRQTAQMFAVGDEGGAFTKTDDISGIMCSLEDTPLVGYNATEITGNRRLVESGIAKPLEPKKVEGILELMNVTAIQDGEPRVKKVTLEQTVKNWIQGPYRKSSSVEGGGVKSASDDVPFWNEFGVPHLAGTQQFLVEEILSRKPEPTWAEGNVEREEIIDHIQSERGQIFTAVVHTRHNGEQKDLEKTFHQVAIELAAFLRKEG